MEKRVARRTNMIGCNIRKGVTPGGFSTRFRATNAERERRARELGATPSAVKEAASVFLEKRGITQHPSDFDRTAISNQCAAAIRARDLANEQRSTPPPLPSNDSQSVPLP